MVTSAAFAQDITVTGTVSDASTGEGIVGASVVLKGSTTQWAMTDDMGAYSLTVPANGVLEVTFLGYSTLEVPVNGRTSIDIELVPEATTLDDVIVVAYGTQKKDAITGSASAISSEKIEKRVVPNLSQALEGMAAGVQVSGTGRPGDDASIRIRGFGSINASQNPLYVVDGAPFDGSLSSINPADIESMTVLKDASSAALYGARAANGVVMITTKRAKGEKINVSYSFNAGWQDRAIKPYQMVDQRDFVNMTYEALRNGYVFTNGYDWETASQLAMQGLSGALGGEQYNPFKNYTWDQLIDPATGAVREDAISAYNEDWMEEVTNHNAFRQEHNLSISGGTEKIKALLSLGYLDQDGILKESGFNRFSGRANVDFIPAKWLSAGLNLSASMTNSEGPTYSGSENSNVWYSAQFMAPIYPVYLKNLDGTNALDELGDRQFDYGVNRPTQANFNSVATLYDDYMGTKNESAGVRTYITLGSDRDDMGWAKGLKFTVNFNADYRNSNGTTYYNMYHGNAASSDGRLTKSNSRMLSYTFNQLLTYDRTFGDHTIGVLAGHEYYDYSYSYLTAQRTGLIDGIIELRPATTVVDGDSYSDSYKIESWLGRLNYDYADRYFLSASIRTDGSSRFHPDHRWGLFWSVGANWNITNEKWMRNVDWIDHLALRASYGVQGNDNLGTYYAWQSFYNLTWANANMSGATVSSLENPNVTWEKNQNLNVGLDFRLFNNILDFSIEYYRRYTSDMLLSFPMALSTGFSGYNANVGNMVNDGVEMALGVQIFNKKNFTWRVNAMGSTTRNEVLKLTDTDQIISGVQVIEVGKPLYTFYMAKSAGVDPATGSQMYWVYDLAEGQEEVMWDGDTPVDQNGNPLNVYRTSDYTKANNSKWYMGSRQPKLYGSIGTEMTIFEFVDLSIMTTYSIGGYIYESLYSGAMQPMYTGNTWHVNALRRWQKPGDITDIPRAEINGSYAANDSKLVDASYFAIKNITLGFSLPYKYAQKIKAQQIRIYMALDNIALFSHLDGMDPQYNFTGGTGYYYTPNKTYSIGLNINF